MNHRFRPPRALVDSFGHHRAAAERRDPVIHHLRKNQIDFWRSMDRRVTAL